MKPIKRVKTKKMKIKKSPDKSKNRDSNRNNTNVTVRKQNDNERFNRIKKKQETKKTLKKDIAIIGDSMIKYMNGRENS